MNADQALLAQSTSLNSLIKANTEDFLASFGLENLQRGRKLLAALCWYPARRFARQMLAFDGQVGAQGLRAGSAWTLQRYVRNLEVSGVENIPAQGPLLVLSNHPGMSDTLVLFASLPRPDLRILAAERPFLQSLSNVSRQLIYVADHPAQRMGAVRRVAGHLRQGGAVLTFPAGEIEPDPASMPGATASLENWSQSIAVFTRLVPETSIVTAIVSGVIWPWALRHPLTRLRRQQKQREQLGAALQVLVQTLLPSVRPVTTRVAYSPPIRATDLHDPQDAAELLSAVRSQARRLITKAS